MSTEGRRIWKGVDGQWPEHLHIDIDQQLAWAESPDLESVIRGVTSQRQHGEVITVQLNGKPVNAVWHAGQKVWMQMPPRNPNG